MGSGFSGHDKRVTAGGLLHGSPMQERERCSPMRSHPRETGSGAPGFEPAIPCSQMVAATFGRWLGGTFGHTSVAVLLGGVVGWLGYRHISRRKLDPVRPLPIISPIFRDCA